ncbi:MAG: hypothetical protein CL666_10410 [Balneola sp.]|nr:hypothetical protein [Balneola sp.]|tara:strand:- start:17783 stop:18067 length:285 start_codon:yes stop_codon:yes gene_type:complete
MWKIEKLISGNEEDISILLNMYKKYGEWIQAENEKKLLIGKLNDEQFLEYLKIFGHVTHNSLSQNNDKIKFVGERPKVTRIRKFFQSGDGIYEE